IYCGFKKGNFIVFGLKWASRRSFVLFAKLPQKVAARIRVPGLKLHRYDGLWKEAVYRVDGDIRVEKFRPLLRAAVQQREKPSPQGAPAHAEAGCLQNPPERRFKNVGLLVFRSFAASSALSRRPFDYRF